MARFVQRLHGQAIPGAASPAQAEENAAAMNLTLSGDELASIDAESRLLMRPPLP